MRKISLAGLAISAVLSLLPSARAQTEDSYTPPRTSWGVPDLQGFWNNSSLTGMERPNGVAALVVSKDEAEILARRNVYTRSAYEDTNVSRLDELSSSRLLADRNTSRAYNHFWLDVGTGYAVVRNEYRTSWVIDPPDGRIPYRAEARAALARSQVFDGPEARPQSERCLMSFTGGAGPVMSNGLYNNNYQIVQTPDAVMILTEMIHDVRIIPINGTHHPDSLPRWGGVSNGWYEGNTLVVETRNSSPGQRSYISAAGKLTERFMRWSDDQILYEFTVEDPTLYLSPWHGEMALNASREPIYEYACHEGNHALPSILAGARQLEREGREASPIPEPFSGIDVTEGQ